MSGQSAVGTARHKGLAPRCVAAVMTGTLLVPVLAGCTGSSGKQTGPAQAVAVADRAALADGGGVTWAVDALPATLNAFQYDAGPVTDQIAQAVLPALFTLDERGRPTLNPDFLVSAEITAEDPRQTVVYTLNPKARWSDGEPVTADDFIAQWKALSGENNAYWTARNAGYDRIDSVEAGEGKGEVEVTFTEPYADWKSLFTPLYPQSVTGEADAFNTASRDRLEVGAGPFSIKAMDRDRGRIALVRNEEWWGDPALLEVLVFAEVERGDRLAALERGDVQVAELDPADADRVSGAENGVRAGDVAAEDAGDAKAAEAAGSAEAAEERGDDASEGAAAPARVPAAAPALLQLAEAQRAAGAAGESVTAKQRAAAERAGERYTEALAAEEEARTRDFAAKERRTTEELSRYTVHRAYEPSYTQLALNGTSEALRDERVRWALGRGLDRRVLASEVHGPARLPVRPVGSHLWVVGQDGYQDNSPALGEPGVQYAAQLLDEAGWRGGQPGESGEEEAGTDAKAGLAAAPAAVPVRLGGTLSAFQQRAALLQQAAGVARELTADGDAAQLAEPADQTERAAAAAQAEAEELARHTASAVRVKEGKALQLRFVLPDGPGGEQLRTVAERIAEMLAEAGVSTVIEEVDSESYFPRYISQGRFDLALYSWPATAYPATDARPLFAKPQSIPGGELFIEQNYARVGTDHIDQLLDQAAEELDDERRQELLNKADARIWSAAGSIPLYQSPQLVAAKQDLAGVGAFGLATPRYQDIGYRE